jgi:drug/metabolite transporter (DMT)-like permease
MSSGREFRAELLLLLAAAIWGFAFVAQRVGMGSVGPFTFSAVRCILGSLALLPLIAVRRKRASAEVLRDGGANSRRPSLGKRALYALIAGSVLFGGASLQQVGLVTTTAGNAAFITSLYVVLVPILGALMGRKIGARGWLAAGLAVVGLYFISVKGSLSVSSGDLLELGGAFFWAAHIIVIGRLAPKTDPIELSAGQFAVTAVLSLVAALFTEPLPFSQAWATGVWAAALPILYAGILSSGVAFTLQIVAQRTARPAPAAILMALEGLFGALGGILLLGEPLTARLAGGGALMLTGAILAQLPARSKDAAHPND